MPSHWDEDVQEYEVEEYKHETDKAWLLVIDGEEYWLAKSQCDYDEEEMVVEIPDWLAEEKGLL